MLINKLRLKNFRNFKNQEFNFGGKNYELKADNGFGKSNVADAISWLITGKLFDASSEVETIKPKHDQKAEVEAELTITDGITLRKVYQENWQKIRGTTELELRGNTTKYYFNGVETTQKGYEEAVERQTGLDREMTMVFMDPTYFGLKLEWKLRREIINKLVGKVSFDEVVAHPVAEKYFNGLSGTYKYGISLRKRLDQHEQRLDATKKTLVQLINRAKKEEIELVARIEGLNLITSPFLTEADYAVAAAEYTRLNEQLKYAKNETDLKRNLENIAQHVATTRSRLEAAYNMTNVYSKPSAALCPHCGKVLNEADYAHLLEKWQKDNAAFESKKLIVINDFKTMLAQYEDEYQALKGVLVGTAGATLINDLNEQIGLLGDKLKKHQAKLATRDVIIEQENKLKDLRETIAALETETDLLSIYVNALYKVIDARLKAKLPDLTFRLIEPNIKDGSWNEVCDLMDGLVPYDRTNTASQIKLGIQLINALREEISIEFLPIIVDNAEAVVDRQFLTQAQVITLVAFK